MLPTVLFRRLCLLLVCCLLLTGAAPAAPPASFADQLTHLLKQYVAADGSVSYAALQRQPAELKELVKQVQTANLAKASAAERKAFYLNAYNLLVISSVVERYPAPSVMKLPGFFDTQKHRVAGELLTLNMIEKHKLRTPYHDARIHFALSSAARGCPRLSPVAFRAESVEQQLDELTRRTLNDAQWVRRDDATKKVVLSELFKWYAGDFKASGKPVLAFVNAYLPAPIPAGYQVEYGSYDWSLNERR
ncbi:DUF547 domain-containing protein [Hymenobacter sp. B81]|uniref:DUF547 domain-containing protein n=1 Tax=Hymenobacter sp. B81 TaxID=3344878 RepID=UPI0037DC070F